MKYLPAIVAALLLNPAGLAAQRGEWRTDFSNHTVPLAEIVSGGPPKDGIPAIDAPQFVSVEVADGWLDGREPVAVLEIGDIVRVYPIQILIWHEIVNDDLGGIPVTVTFCPLCNTTLAFDRRLDDRVLDFGTTGRLRHSDLVMYDRQTETWWQQATGQGIVGEYAGRNLRPLGAPVVRWADAKQTYPRAEVLSRSTGYSRDYGNNPYQGYDNVDRGRPFASFFRGMLDDRLPAMARVVTVSVGSEHAAYPFATLEDERVVNDRVGGLEIVVLWAPGTSSALDSRSIARGRDVGSGTAYSRVVDDRILRFESVVDGRFRDRETGSQWNVLGLALNGPLSGRRLEPLPHGNHFWFAWAVFAPETEIRD